MIWPFNPVFLKMTFLDFQYQHPLETHLKSELLALTSEVLNQKLVGGVQQTLLTRFPVFLDSSVGNKSASKVGEPGLIPGPGRSSGEEISLPTPAFLGLPVAQLVKKPPAMWETLVWSLCWEDPLEKGQATHSSVLAWRIPWVSPWGRKELDITEQLSLPVDWYLLKSENHYFYLTWNIRFSVNKSPEIIRTMIIFLGKIRKYSSSSITFLEINFKRNVKALKWHHQNPQCSSFPLYVNWLSLCDFRVYLNACYSLSRKTSPSVHEGNDWVN